MQDPRCRGIAGPTAAARGGISEVFGFRDQAQRRRREVRRYMGPLGLARAHIEARVGAGVGAR
jgi:hypothetical protein